MVSVSALIDRLRDCSPATVTEAGDHLLQALSGTALQPDQFVKDPLVLIGPPYFASRYLTQVALRALQNDYETLDEVLTSLNALVERNPPILEPKREVTASRVVL